jgi:hypothetical protein
MRSLAVISCCLGLHTAITATPTSSPTPEQIEFFESRVRPVLIEHCYSCHSAQADRVRGGFWLDSPEALLRGGDSGPALVPGDPDASLLITAVRHTDPDLRMPPQAPKLDALMIADLEAWVNMGAPDPRHADATQPPVPPHEDPLARQHWAFLPVVKPTPPSVRHTAWILSPVDAFVLAGLETHQLKPAPAADRRTLLRRITYDLTGLPPTPAETRQFLEDPSPDAYARVVDRLLASPRYGERWGRYWLDVARYADTKGYVFQEERRYAYAHTYRDYVIDAFNTDKPYDQFLVEQLAADQLDLAQDNRPLAALGFLTLGRRFLNNQNDIIDDRIDVVFRGLQALTVSCARCHDHKFDPIPTRDYYALHGVFASSEEPAELPVLASPVDPDQHARFTAEKEKLTAALETRTNEEIERFREAVLSRRPDYLSAARALIDSPDDLALDTLATERNLVAPLLRRVRDSLKAQPPPPHRPAGPPDETAVGESQVHTAESGEPEAPLPTIAQPDPFDLPAQDVRRWARVQISEATASLRNQIADLEITHPGAPLRAMALVDKPQPVEPHVFIRGNPGTRGPSVPRRFLSILSGPDAPPFQHGSGRLELAQAIANPNNPLTARVIVNRVWLGHFGEGLVRTPSDFGLRTEAPPHLALLDYLAASLVEYQWSLKQLHRLIVLSNTYQQSSADHPAYSQMDPANQWLWRMNRRRLDFEATRDTLLAVAGNLDLSHGGRSVDIVGDQPAPRRTLYGFVDRQNLPGLFRTFDFANPDLTSPRRFTTTVPQQALYLMNHPFVILQARHLAQRPEIREAPDLPARIHALYQLVHQRAPDPIELDLASAFLTHTPHTFIPKPPSQAWQYGHGAYDPDQQRLTHFTPFEHFADGRWQPTREYPSAALGYVALHATGGHPGSTPHSSAVRRWTAPTSGLITVEGTLEHQSDKGDGVHALIVHPSHGPVGRWTVHNGSSTTLVAPLPVQAGDNLDFIVECRSSPDYDSFEWIPLVRLLDVDPHDVLESEWNAATDFVGPGRPKPGPLDPWERYAHVLLQSNELVFLD